MTYRLLLSILSALILSILPAQADTVRWGRSGDAMTLDPHAAADTITMQLVGNIYEPLVEYDPDGSLAGTLASSWLQSAEDPNLWVFNLRRAVFQDGAALDAADVVFSFDRAKGDGSALKEEASDIISVRALAPNSVEIRVATPSPVLPAVIADIMIMDKEWAAANGLTEAKQPGAGEEAYTARNANGTGPYKLDSRDPDVRTKLVAHQRYWGTPPAAGEVTYLPIANPAMQATALLWGEIDVLQDVDLADIGRLDEAEDITVTTGPANAVVFLGYRFGAANAAAGEDTAKNPFDDPKVRQAIELAIDRTNAAGFADRGHAEPTAILAPPFVNGWSKGLSVQVTPDKARARELLAEAGYPDGFAVKLDVANANAAVANRISSMLTSIGIWANVVARPQAAHDAHIASGESAFYVSDYEAPGYDSAAVLEWLVKGHAGYENASLAARIDALATIGNRSQRNAEIASIWLAVQQERIVLPIAQHMIAHAMRDTISLPVDPNNQTRFSALRFKD